MNSSSKLIFWESISGKKCRYVEFQYSNIKAKYLQHLSLKIRFSLSQLCLFSMKNYENHSHFYCGCHSRKHATAIVQCLGWSQSRQRYFFDVVKSCNLFAPPNKPEIYHNNTNSYFKLYINNFFSNYLGIKNWLKISIYIFLMSKRKSSINLEECYNAILRMKI